MSAYTGQEAFLPVDVGNQTSFTYAGLSEGQTYSIAVVSYNTAGESSFSNIETFTPSTVTQGSSGEYDITYQMMRHDTRSSGDYYRGYLSFTKNGLPLTNQDFVNLSLSNSSGTTVPITLVSNGNVETYNSIKANCSNLSCTWDPPSIETGISFNVGALALDDYTVTVDMADKQFSTVIPYNEDITLPIVDDATMQAAWQDENLVLSWSNPISDPNWNKVNKLRVSLYDISGFYGILELDPSNSTLVVPLGLIKDIEDYGDGTLYRLRIQTLSYTNDPRNSQNARGWSNRAGLKNLNSAISG